MATGGNTPPSTPPSSPEQETPFGRPTDEELTHVLNVAKIAARRYGAVSHEVDEVSQLTAIKLLDRWEAPATKSVRAKGGARWDAYIRRTAKNVHLDQIRSHHRRLERNTKASPVRVDLNPQRPGTVHQIPTTADGVNAHLARQAIVDLIDTLPAKQRLVARLILVDEMSPREAAEALHMQPQLVRKHLRAAKESLIRQLNPPDDA